MRRRDGERDGQKLEGRFHRRVLVLAADGPDPETTQTAIVGAFLDVLVEQLGERAAKMPRKLAEATALEAHAAIYLNTWGWPKKPRPVPYAGPSKPMAAASLK